MENNSHYVISVLVLIPLLLSSCSTKKADHSKLSSNLDSRSTYVGSDDGSDNRTDDKVYPKTIWIVDDQKRTLSLTNEERENDARGALENALPMVFGAVGGVVAGVVLHRMLAKMPLLKRIKEINYTFSHPIDKLGTQHFDLLTKAGSRKPFRKFQDPSLGDLTVIEVNSLKGIELGADSKTWVSATEESSFVKKIFPGGLEKIKSLSKEDLKKSAVVDEVGQFKIKVNFTPIRVANGKIVFEVERRVPSVKNVLQKKFGDFKVAVIGADDSRRAGKFYTEMNRRGGIRADEIEGHITEPRDLLVESVRSRIKGDPDWDKKYEDLSSAGKKQRGNLAALTIAHYRVLKNAVEQYKNGRDLMRYSQPGTPEYLAGRKLMERNQTLIVTENNASFGFKGSNGQPTMDGLEEYLEEGLNQLPDDFSVMTLMGQDFLGSGKQKVGDGPLHTMGYPLFSKAYIVNIERYGEEILEDFTKRILGGEGDIVPSDHMYAQLLERGVIEKFHALGKQVIYREQSVSTLGAGTGPVGDHYFAPDL